jgi:hypothetical protein
MVLIKDVTLTGKRPSIITGSETIKKKTKEVYVPGVGMMLVEEPTTVDVNITIVLTEKEEAEIDAAVKKMFDSK